MRISRRTMLMAGLAAGGRLLGWGGCDAFAGPASKNSSIDRQAVVKRHNLVVSSFDPSSSLTVGNGNFAFTCDVTGLQTFADECRKDFPLCTCAHWAWHTTPAPAGVRPADFQFKEYESHGRMVGYATDKTGQEALFDWLRENPHRMHLGRIGLVLRGADGAAAKPRDLSAVRQMLDLWNGVIESRFEFGGKSFRVQTACHGLRDLLAVRIESGAGAAVRVAFPYPSAEMDMANWNSRKKHQTLVEQTKSSARFARVIDSDKYFAVTQWNTGTFSQAGEHEFLISSGNADTLEIVFGFSPGEFDEEAPGVQEVFQSSADSWERFWTSGAAIDLSPSSDERAEKLERRIVLSQYNTAIHCAGPMPPPESGLLFNTWYGKSHLEMHWWHGVHFAAWNRFELLQRSLNFYSRILPVARATAQRQGYAGVRWPKMVGPEGHDSPSPIGPLLIWQQPHPIYYAELCYRRQPTKETLEKCREIVFSSADFLASFAALEDGRYVLGPPLKPVPENTETMQTKNPAFELAYCRFGLSTAQLWRKRMGMEADTKWAEVLEKLSALPTDDGRYLMMEGMTDTYTKWNWEHPSLLGMMGMLPGEGVDRETMQRSLQKAMEVWEWDRCWGWDFPLAAMCAARLGEGELAIKALMMESVKNRWLANGHVYQRANLPAYLPANGGLLAAIAVMTDTGTFPKDGTWSVRSEGFSALL